MGTPDQPLPLNPRSSPESSPADLFGGPPPEPAGRGKLIGAVVAIAFIALVAAGLFFRSSHIGSPASSKAILQADPYAMNLAFTQLAMSQSTSLSGGTSTFIDGHVKNSGPDTVTGVTMQVLFRNDVALPPQVETLPLTLIRTHDPYVDTEPVSAAPLKPGGEVEFRLIFETVTGSWNQQMPELHVIHVTKH